MKQEMTEKSLERRRLARNHTIQKDYFLADLDPSGMQAAM
jgi:hypothetical protein